MADNVMRVPTCRSDSTGRVAAGAERRHVPKGKPAQQPQRH
jgi:hypothetical protein